MRSIVILIVVVAILAVLYHFTLSRESNRLANDLSKKMGVAVSIDPIKPRLSSITVNQLEIANAQGYTLPKAFSARTIKLHAPIATYFQDHVVVDQIDVDTIYLGIEFDTTSSGTGNWTQLMGHYKKEAKLDRKVGKSVLIKKIVFTNINSDLIFRSEGSGITKLDPIPRMVLTNISTEEGLPIDQLTSSILGQMLIEAFRQYHLNNMLEGVILDVPGKAVEIFMKPFEGIFNAAPKEELNLKYSA